MPAKLWTCRLLVHYRKRNIRVVCKAQFDFCAASIGAQVHIHRSIKKGDLASDYTYHITLPCALLCLCMVEDSKFCKGAGQAPYLPA